MCSHMTLSSSYFEHLSELDKVHSIALKLRPGTD